ncbi:calcium-binding protein [Methylobacterium nigriterrae]|uniref:calcium-binding protein n=1 Tax=Methylobacterium nigriterrae TaxID=3127512 RepID=UPI0030132E67
MANFGSAILKSAVLSGSITSAVSPFPDKLAIIEGQHLTGTNGDDVMYGGWGNDDIWGGPHGHDVLYGGYGNDTLSASWDGSTLYGGAGKDTLLGGPSNDTLYGGAGDDLIYGGTGVDQLYGGEGHDTFTFGPHYTDLGYSGSDTGDFTKGQADTIHDFTADDTIKLVGDFTYAGNTETPGVGSYGVSGSDGHYMVTYHLQDGYHDILVEGADPTGHVVVSSIF